MSQDAQTVDLLGTAVDVAPSSDQEKTSEDTVRHLAFTLGERPFALEMRHVLEIVGMQQATPLHDVEPYVRGLINLRGHVVPIIDVAMRIGLPPRVYDDRTCIIVLSVDGQKVGLIVDRVQRVVDLPESLLVGSNQQACRDGEEIVIRLDPAFLVQPPGRDDRPKQPTKVGT